MLIHNLFENFSIILVFFAAYSFLVKYFKEKKLKFKIISGIIFGMLSILAMMFPFEFTSGVIFDIRTIVIVIASYFGGIVTGLITVIFSVAYRIYLGGSGMVPGVGIIITAWFVGIAFHNYNLKRDIRFSFLNLYSASLITHIAMILWMCFLPEEISIKVLRVLPTIVIVFYPLLTLVFGFILKEQEILASVERKIKYNEEKYRNIFNNIIDVYFEIDESFNIIEITPSVKENYGFNREDLIGRSFLEIFLSEEQSDKFKNIIEEWGKLKNFEINFKDNNGDTSFSLLTAGIIKDEKEIKITGILKDITQRRLIETQNKELETQLSFSHKMEAIGLLAGGVAHDLNNILSGIVGYPDVLLYELPEDSELVEPLETIRDSGQQAVDIVQDLLTLARRGMIVKKPLKLNRVIKTYLSSPEFEVVKERYPDIEVKTDLNEKLYNINGSETHIRKTIMNLIINAFESHEDKGKLMKGEVLIKTDNEYVDITKKAITYISEGEYVKFSISDTGKGMTHDEMIRIFDPFYTSKKTGVSGSGLGMAVVWGAIQDHNAFVDVTSDEGEGSTFEIYFPLTRNEELIRDERIDISEFMGDGEKILVIDDVKTQREVVSSMLKKLNYKYEVAESGEEGIRKFGEEHYDLVILDMIMEPGIDGLETFKELLKINPEIKAILTSGFSETDRTREALRLGAGIYLKKPFLIDRLALVIKNELEKL